MKLAATFSPDRKYRYSLSRIWNEKCPLLMWIMLNPSRADQTRDDPTIKHCVTWSINAGYGGILVYNLFAHRSTYPESLLTAKDPVGPENDERIIQAIRSVDKAVCAWGTVSKKLAWRPLYVLGLLENLTGLYALRFNKGGDPAHPLYLRYNLKLSPIDVDAMKRVYRERNAPL